MIRNKLYLLIIVVAATILLATTSVSAFIFPWFEHHHKYHHKYHHRSYKHHPSSNEPDCEEISKYVKAIPGKLEEAMKKLTKYQCKVIIKCLGPEDAERYQIASKCGKEFK